MSLFSRFSKPAFWTQFLIGILAVFALPAVSANEANVEREIVEQQVISLQQSIQAESEQAIFLAQESLKTAEFSKQAAGIFLFSRNIYRLLPFSHPLVRAGPAFRFKG